MARIFENFHNGTITDNPLSSGATTINSAEFEDLPVIANPDTAFIVLDPLGVDGDPEIVRVAAHTSSATSITVDRGEQTALNGGAARAHNQGTAWRMTFTAGDILSTAVGSVEAEGDLFHGSDTRSVTRLAIGTDGQVLTSDGSVPTWSSGLLTIDRQIRPDGLNLNDDEAAFIELTNSGTGGTLIVTGNVSAAAMAIVSFRVGDGGAFALELVSAGTSPVDVQTGGLNGTTGNDGSLTISAGTGLNRVFIENRTGGTRGYGFSFLGMRAGDLVDGSWTIV